MSPTYTFTEVFDPEAFDPLAFFNETPCLQAFFYGEWQKSVGRKARRFVVRDVSTYTVVAMFQLIIYTLPFQKRCGYIPYGPVIFKNVEKVFFKELSVFLSGIGVDEGLVFIRTDSTYAPYVNSFVQEGVSMRVSPRSTYHSSFMQPRFEWRLNLEPTREEIIARFHKNTRYSIRVAEKCGVTTQVIETNISSHFDTFFEVLQETAKRDHFFLHPASYYKNIFSSCDEHKNGVVFLSTYKGLVLAANLVILFGNTAFYIFGGTRSEQRNVMPAYAAQMKTIEYLKEKKYTWYNFGGISTPHDAQEAWSGITTFKKRFGGEVVAHEYVHDVVVDRLWYYLYVLYKNIF